jgi:hypothetical protein
LFWKKKQPRNETFIHDNGKNEIQSRRGFFRYKFSGSHNLEIRFLNKDVELVDMSAGGLSFRDNGFAKGDRDKISLPLRDKDRPFEYLLYIEIEILSIDAEEICHCTFENPEKEQTEAIHRFLLIKQKKDLQAEKGPT